MILLFFFVWVTLSFIAAGLVSFEKSKSAFAEWSLGGNRGDPASAKISFLRLARIDSFFSVELSIILSPTQSDGVAFLFGLDFF
jgi:hypothetical protein